MNYFEAIFPFVNHDNIHVATAIFVFIILTTVSIVVYIKMKNPQNNVIPDDKISIKNILETLIEKLANMANDIIGKEGEKYLPLLGTVFIFILLSNLLGLIPGFLPPTENMNTNLACGLCIFIATHYYGLKEHGMKYLKHFMAPITGIFGIFLSLIFFPIEIVSHVFRPMSLSIRLFGNINGDHAVLSIFSDLVPVAIPVLFLFLGLLVAIIQALVFTLLSMIYISLAVSHDH